MILPTKREICVELSKGQDYAYLIASDKDIKLCKFAQQKMWTQLKKYGTELGYIYENDGDDKDQYYQLLIPKRDFGQIEKELGL